MINKQTVLILGAGASMSFGFPSGRELKNNIITQFMASPNAQFHDILIDSNQDITGEKIKEFGNALLESGQPSVDRFLEKRPKFMTVGKATIALELIKCEVKARLFNTEPNQHWYEYLFNKLGNNLDDFDNNKLDIITFNYDRSLEYYLTTALANAYGIELDEAHTTLKTMAIIHVHGKLGNIHFGKPSYQARAYEPIADFVTLPFCLEESGIKIISEANSNSTDFQSARNLINSAEMIVILGLGYDRINLERIGMLRLTQDQAKKNTHAVRIMGSAHGLTDSERNIYTHMLHDRIMLDPVGYDTLKFLREESPFD